MSIEKEQAVCNLFHQMQQINDSGNRPENLGSSLLFAKRSSKVRAKVDVGVITFSSSTIKPFYRYV
jgi:hypothetical protein